MYCKKKLRMQEQDKDRKIERELSVQGLLIVHAYPLEKKRPAITLNMQVTFASLCLG